MNIDKNDTAVVFIDPQNEVLSEKGLAWPSVHESLREIGTIANMERIFKAAKAHGFEVFISPHYFYPTDKGWKFNGPLETDEADEGYFARKGPYTIDGLKGSGADWLERFKPFIRGRQNRRGRTASRVGTGDQRPRVTTSQAQDQQDHSRRHARQHVRRISPARIAGTRIRGSRGERRDCGAQASRMGLWLYGGAHQLCFSRACGLDDGRSRQGNGTRFLTPDQPRSSVKEAGWCQTGDFSSVPITARKVDY